ncbi:hypothetical protein GUITHDRAFT_114239 [Guillardia theta CCMP2712]|uniref:Uncharacterized protein n=1 Tax=Guillardia theta (strain CCMP2712) TaxID=905079 RepID=L1IU00_GUITC|nr:hypothetical protein GUITHDRAFT_114239 [Guillardia theta CCMP2712]EKX39741.1 hypothetical protein GUITHDRAFT_114239 [Guillardia theta CCMP2712]|eukprot:XP_005826721.1 hypothetical protein GUITHDRAFT_114239 [Guillardia theta CCMP2712]
MHELVLLYGVDRPQQSGYQGLHPASEKPIMNRFLVEATEIDMPHAFFPRAIVCFTSIQLAVTLSFCMFYSDQCDLQHRLAFGGGLLAFSGFAFWSSLMLQDRYISKVVAMLNTKKVKIHTPFFLADKKIEADTSAIKPALMKSFFTKERLKKEEYDALLQILGLLSTQKSMKN